MVSRVHTGRMHTDFGNQLSEAEIIVLISLFAPFPKAHVIMLFVCLLFLPPLSNFWTRWPVSAIWDKQTSQRFETPVRFLSNGSYTEEEDYGNGWHSRSAVAWCVLTHTALAAGPWVLLAALCCSSSRCWTGSPGLQRTGRNVACWK